MHYVQIVVPVLGKLLLKSNYVTLVVSRYSEINVIKLFHSRYSKKNCKEITSHSKKKINYVIFSLQFFFFNFVVIITAKQQYN